MHLTLNLGTHEITLLPVGESWLANFTWHKQVMIHNWRLQDLANWAENAENERNYVMAEAKFIWLATGKRGILKQV